MYRYNMLKIVMITGIIFLLSGCSPILVIRGLGSQVDKSLSPWYYYNLFHTKIFVVSSAAFESRQEVKDANPKTFSVLSVNYAKDDEHVFFGNKLIRGADPKTAHLPSQYLKQEPDELNHNYWLVDNKHVYLGGKVIDADSGSFKSWESGGGSFGMDKNSIFCNDKKMPGNSKGFKHLFGPYFVNDSILYHLSGNACYYLDNVDMNSLSTFTFDDGTKSDLYIKDKNKVYCLDKAMFVIKGADPKTFRVISRYSITEYAKDKYHVYINGEVAMPEEAYCISKGGMLRYISEHTQQCILNDKNGNETKCGLHPFYNGKCK